MNLPGFILASFAALALSLTLPAQADQPRLVLQITVDGLRADLLPRYAENFGKGGFDRLLDDGLVFTNARYLHANTETIVGHTTLATGATPAVHGMVGNVWYHGSRGELGYNIEDASAPLLPTTAEAVEGAQVDPAQKRAGSKGRSPRGILVPTFSDTLVIGTEGRGKNFAVSGKDRSAVAMAGHSGTAYWYSTDTGHFQTSRYYMEDYPDWVKRWNAQDLAAAWSGKQWRLSLPRERYRFTDQDDRAYELDLRGYGRTFPHAFGDRRHPLFYTRLLVSAEGDALLSEFAKTLVAAEALGQDEIVDYLSVSFSSVDAVNHFFGPGSLENEEAVLRLDRTLADLFSFIDKTVGMEHTLVVLSADHGIPEMPEYATELGIKAGRVAGQHVLATARRASKAAFGRAELVKDFFRPYVYLDEDALQEAGVSKTDASEVIAAALENIEGIHVQLPGTGSNLPVAQAVDHNQHPQRSGDLYVYQAPYWFLMEGGTLAVMHGSPWEYDRHVPLIFLGRNIPGGTVTRPVHPIDVAPTLSALIGLLAPAGAQGSALDEALGD